MWIISANNIYADGKSRRHLFSFLKLFQKLADSKGRAFGRSPQTAKPLCLFKAQERVNFLSKGKKEGKPSPGVFLFINILYLFGNGLLPRCRFRTFAPRQKFQKRAARGHPSPSHPVCAFFKRKLCKELHTHQR